MDLIQSYCSVDTPRLPSCYSALKDLAPVVFALVLGIIASVLTWRQYRVSRTQMHLDLFEKRLKVYNSLLLNLANDMGDAQLDQGQRSAALVDIEAARFLFPGDARRLIADIQTTVAAHEDAKQRWAAMKSKPQDHQTKVSATQMIDLRQRYDSQLKELSEKMAQFMPFGQIRS